MSVTKKAPVAKKPVAKKATAKKTTAKKPAAKKPVVKKEEAEVTAKEANLNVAGPQEEMEANLSSFVYMNKTRDILDISVDTNKNVILHGKGGYGKSEFTEAYLRGRGITPYTITMGSGMTTDRLFGGVDLNQFNKSGKIEYLIENSFMNQEYVIFEELFDAPDFILEQLKDILSSGIFRNGSQVFSIKTKNIICCTNRTREEFSKNNSLKALMERFPLELEVGWKDHTRINYEHLLEAKFGPGNADPMLTYVLETFGKKGHTISPRIAIVAAELIRDCGPNCLEFIADFKAQEKVLKDALSKFKAIADIAEKVNKLSKLQAEVEEAINNGITSKSQAEPVSKLISKMSREVKNLSAIKADDSLAVSTAKKVDLFKKSVSKFEKFINTSVKVGALMED
jgi:MoxR-like ATPase